MKQSILCFLIGIFFSLAATENHTLSVCAIFRNEAPYLKEWLEFHQMMGAQHFTLYNNESDDHYLEILKPYVEKGIVELIDWPNQMDEPNWTHAQKRAYNHCVQKDIGKTKWLALIDVDEFIIPVDSSDIPSYLSQFDERPEIGGIQINWQLYGTSGLADIPQGKLLTECLTRKAPSYFIANEGVDNTRYKSIVRPEAVNFYEVHYAIYKEGFTFYPPLDPLHPIQIDHIRINHYWPRTEEFFYRTKLDRRLQLFPLAMQQMIEKLSILNQEEDLIMAKFIPELKNRLIP